MRGSSRGRWAALGLLATAMVLGMTTWFSVAAVGPQLRLAWSLSTLTASLLDVAVQVGFVAGALLIAAANLPDIMPPRTLILLGSLGAALANVLLLTSPSVGLAIALRLLTGAFLAGVYPPALKAMLTWFEAGRGTVLGVMVGALTLGSAAPQLVNALGGANWRTVIVVTSALTVVGGVVTRCLVKDGPFSFPPAVFAPRQAAAVLRNRAVRLAYLGYFGHMWELYAMWTWIYAFSRAELHPGGVERMATIDSLAAFAIVGSGALGCLAGGILGDRWGRTRVTRLSMALSGSCCLVIGPAAHLGAVVLLAVGIFWGFWVVADSAQFTTIVTETCDQAYVGTAVTLQIAVGFTLSVVTIWLIPFVQGKTGWTWAFAILAPGPLLGVAAMTRLLHSPEARLIAGGRG